MASFFNLTLDTLAPQGVAVKINNGAIYTANKVVNLSISCSDADTTGYSMKIYGSVVGAAKVDDAKWETYSTAKQVTLTDGDGLKTVYVIIRDAVWNESTAASATITLNTSIPVVTIVGPDVSIISEIAGKNASKFNFTADQVFDEYKVDQLILLEVMEIILLLRTLKRRLLVPTSRLLPVVLMELISSRCS